MIIAGGQLTVDNAVKLAAAIGISERIIGLTIIAIGTSLPEFITFGVACKKNETGLAFGAIIGSNIFNILFILGLAGLISPLTLDNKMIFDMAFLIAGSLISLLFIYTGKRLGRREGAVMLTMYVGYVVYIFVQ
jgi:cation:H+ antiporter